MLQLTVTAFIWLCSVLICGATEFVSLENSELFFKLNLKLGLFFAEANHISVLAF